ncbi:Diaminopimelate epimerase-like protein [Thozetella sp. PMI_491]|nr:Diaminopimelate epimerase-like protein [Thozetella sp. PMI_491]
MSAPLKLDFVTLDVFTDTRFLGNPLAVVLVPAKVRESLSHEAKQRVAKEFNLSETVFLHVPDEPDHSQTSLDMNIFTIESELPFAGHPTIGTAYLVLNHFKWKQVDSLVPKAGRIGIAVDKGLAVKATIPHDVHIHKNTLGSLLFERDLNQKVRTVIDAGLTEDDAIRKAELAAPVVSIVKGMSFLLVKLENLEQLAKVSAGRRLVFEDIPNLLDPGLWGNGFIARYYYVPTAEPTADGLHQIRTRMVELGFEDPATGSAASTLASYLALTTGAEKTRFEVTQGVELGRKSDIVIEVSAEGGEQPKIKDLVLGGEAVVVMSGSIQV